MQLRTQVCHTRFTVLALNNRRGDGCVLDRRLAHTIAGHVGLLFVQPAVGFGTLCDCVQPDSRSRITRMAMIATAIRTPYPTVTRLPPLAWFMLASIERVRVQSQFD